MVLCGHLQASTLPIIMGQFFMGMELSQNNKESLLEILLFSLIGNAVRKKGKDSLNVLQMNLTVTFISETGYPPAHDVACDDLEFPVCVTQVLGL